MTPPASEELGEWGDICPFCLGPHTFLGHCEVPEAPAYVVYGDAGDVDVDPRFVYVAPCADEASAREAAAFLRNDPGNSSVRVWSRRPIPSKVNNNSGRDGYRYIRLDAVSGGFANE